MEEESNFFRILRVQATSGYHYPNQLVLTYIDINGNIQKFLALLALLALLAILVGASRLTKCFQI